MIGIVDAKSGNIGSLKNALDYLKIESRIINDPREIVFLLNLLLKNDKRDTISERDIFYPDGSLTDDGVKILEEESKGIVSYLRGENPLAFPMRLEPHSKNVNLIKQTISHQEIEIIF